MRKFFTILLAFIVLIVLPKLVLAKTDSIIVAKDPNFSNVTRNFSPSDTIYIKVTSNSSGSKQATLTLMTGESKTLQTYQLNKVSENPFTYTVSLTVPRESGVYLLSARVEDNESSFAGVVSITVGQGGNVSTKIESNISTGGNTTNSNSQTSPSPKQNSSGTANNSVNVVNLPAQNNENAAIASTSSPSVSSKSAKPKIKNTFNIFSRIAKFFADIFSKIVKFLVF